MTRPAAIVLAAGEGRRMGGPKALLVVDGKPLIHAHVQRLQELGCSPIIVVMREATAAALGTITGVEIIAANTDSMAGSLKVAVASLSPGPDRIVIVAPIDTLPARRSTLHALLTAASVDGVHVATPQYRGRSGHPIAIREELLQVFRAGYAGTLRDLVRSAGAARQRLEVADASVQIDLNTPADLAAFRTGVTPCFAHAAADGGASQPVLSGSHSLCATR
jgi:CTP:molybdopterin cytidylyltransferase MocA